MICSRCRYRRHWECQGDTWCDCQHKGGKAKLVRDKIPQILPDDQFHVADTEEYRTLLREKLVEEVEEFLSSGEPEELADILEVLKAIAEDLGRDLEGMRIDKELERGNFDGRIVWSGAREVSKKGD